MLCGVSWRTKFGIIWHDYVARNDLKSAIVSVTGFRTPSLVWNALRFNHLRRLLDEN